MPTDLLHSDHEGCPAIVPGPRDAVGPMYVCDKPWPCPDHPGLRFGEGLEGDPQPS